MIITLGWWLAPLAVTILSFIGWLWYQSSNSTGSDTYGIGSLINMFMLLVICVVPSLIAWLLWLAIK